MSKHSEADYLGLIFSSLAGYDINESYKVWERVVATYKSNTFQKSLIFLASCGYAFPGTILAVGVVVFVGWLNEINVLFI